MFESSKLSAKDTLVLQHLNSAVVLGPRCRPSNSVYHWYHHLSIHLFCFDLCAFMVAWIYELQLYFGAVAFQILLGEGDVSGGCHLENREWQKGFAPLPVPWLPVGPWRMLRLGLVLQPPFVTVMAPAGCCGQGWCRMPVFRDACGLTCLPPCSCSFCLIPGQRGFKALV